MSLLQPVLLGLADSIAIVCVMWDYFTIDTCLDAGGAWSNGTHCEGLSH